MAEIAFTYFFFGFLICGLIVIPLSERLRVDKNKIIKDYLEGKL